MLAVEWPLIRAAIRPRTIQDVRAEWKHDIKGLDDCKRQVPKVQAQSETRAKLWRRLTTPPKRRSTDCEPDLVASRAYHKMKEIAESCGLPRPSGMTTHLCEAPGGFVQALQHDTPSLDWAWKAISRRDGPQPRIGLLPMERGMFLTGDVFDWDWCVSNLTKNGSTMVTADGAADMDHEVLEKSHFGLLLAQTRLALYCLEGDGVLVIKFFEGLTAQTQTWIAVLTTRFREVSVIKPEQSRATNSERYLVCKYFDGKDEAFDVDGSVVSTAWHAQVSECMQRMANTQLKALQKALSAMR